SRTPASRTPASRTPASRTRTPDRSAVEQVEDGEPAGSGPVEAGLAVGVVEVGRAQGRRVEHPTPLELLDDRRVLGGHLADEQGLEVAAPGQVVEHRLEAAEVDRVLHVAPTPVDAQRDLPRPQVGEAVL